MKNQVSIPRHFFNEMSQTERENHLRFKIRQLEEARQRVADLEDFVRYWQDWMKEEA